MPSLSTLFIPSDWHEAIVISKWKEEMENEMRALRKNEIGVHSHVKMDIYDSRAS